MAYEDYFDFGSTPDMGSFDYAGSLADLYAPLDNSLGFDINSMSWDPSYLTDAGYTVDGGSSFWDDPLSSSWDWLSTGDNAKNLISLGTGALGMYGNWQANKAKEDYYKKSSKAAMMNAQTQRDLAKSGQAADLAGRAGISDILANRGHLGASQSNPWMNYLYQAQKESGFTPNGANPFSGYNVGQEISPLSNEDLLAGLQAQLQNAPTVGYAGGGIVREGMEALRHLRPGQLVKHGVNPSEISPEWLRANAQGIQEDYMKMMQGLAETTGHPFDPDYEMQFIQDTLNNGVQPQSRARGGLGHIQGQGGGQDDLVDASLSPDEYVMDADVVAALGDGSPQEGAKKLDRMRENIRQHKRSASAKNIPPMAKDPMKYLG